MAPRSKTPWADLLASMRDELRGTAAAQANKRRGAAEFADWADKSGVPFPAVNALAAEQQFKLTLDVHKRADGSLNKQGEACLAMAREMMERSSATKSKVEVSWEDAVKKIAREVSAESRPEDVGPAFGDLNSNPPEDTMANRNEETEEERDVEEPEEGDEETDEVDEVEEEPPPRRRRAAPVIRERIVERRPSKPAVRVAQGRSAAVKHILPRPEKIRLYKRDEMGKRMLIDDFAVDEIGDMKLESFIREYIHEEFGNDGVDTQYIAYELDARTGNEKAPPSSITVRALAQEPQPQDPFTNVSRAMHMLSEMQGMMQPQQQQQPSSTMEAAKSIAMKGGDMQSMFMLMMMERMMQQAPSSTNQQTEALLRILDRLDRVEKGGGRNPGPEFGGPPSFGGFPMPPMMPFQQAPAPAPERSHDRLLDLAMAKLAQPPPSLADSVKELLALQSLMQPRQGDSAEIAALRAEIRALAGGQKAAPDSLEANLANFEKMTTMAKSISTQIGGGGDVSGFFKGLLTPEVAKAIAGVVQQVKPATPPAPVVPAAPAPPPPRDFNSPPFPLPKSVEDAGKAFMMAQTSEVQAARFVDFVLAMYVTQDPYYVKLLSPALEALNKAEESVENLKPARALATQLIHEMRPPLASPDFVDACLAAMAMKAGVERLPETLISTRGKWTFNGRDVVMQTTVAVPVPGASPANVIKFPAVEPSVSREQREKELGYKRDEPATQAPEVQKMEGPIEPAPAVPVAQPVPPPPSTQVIEAPPQRELVPAQSTPSA